MEWKPLWILFLLLLGFSLHVSARGQWETQWSRTYTPVYGNIEDIRQSYGQQKDVSLLEIDAYSTSFFWENRLWILWLNRGIFQLDLDQNEKSAVFYSLPGITHMERRGREIFCDSYLDIIQFQWNEEQQVLELLSVYQDRLDYNPRDLALALYPVNHVLPQLHWQEESLVIHWNMSTHKERYWIPHNMERSPPPPVAYARRIPPRRFSFYEEDLYYIHLGAIYQNDDSSPLDILKPGSESHPDCGPDHQECAAYPREFIGKGWIQWIYPARNFPVLHHVNRDEALWSPMGTLRYEKDFLVESSYYEYGTKRIYRMMEDSYPHNEESPLFEAFCLGSPMDHWVQENSWILLQEDGQRFSFYLPGDTYQEPTWMSPLAFDSRYSYPRAAGFDGRFFYRLVAREEILSMEMWEYGENSFTLIDTWDYTS